MLKYLVTALVALSLCMLVPPTELLTAPAHISEIGMMMATAAMGIAVEHNDWLDTPIRGMRMIALAAGYVTEHGEPDIKAAYYAYSQGRLDATKDGKLYVSTRRRLGRVARGETTPPIPPAEKR
jgi:hypothetical protein